MICLLTRPQFTPRLYDNSIDFRFPAIIPNVRASCQEHQVVFGRLSYVFGNVARILDFFFGGGAPIFLPCCVCMILRTYVV